MDPHNTQPGPPPQPVYSGPPQQHQQMPPPQQQAPPRSGGGLGAYINATVDASPVERFTIMLLRLIAWIALIILVIGLCGDFFNVVLSAGNQGGDTFRFLVNGFVSMLRNFAVGAVTAATLLALASIVESLIVMRRNRM